MGNRGILHDAQQRLGAARWRHPHWIFCRLDVQGAPAPGDGAPPLHRAVLPRRGDRARRRPPTLLRMPARGFSAVSGGVAAGVRAGRVPAGGDRPGPAPGEGRAARAPPDPLRGAARRSARWRLRAAAGRRSPLLVRGDRLEPWRPGGYGPSRARRAGRVSRADPGTHDRRAARRLSAGPAWAPREHSLRAGHGASIAASRRAQRRGLCRTERP